MQRRGFIKLAGTGLAGAGVLSSSGYSAFAQEQARPLKKSLKFGMIREDLTIKDKFMLLKELGFDGVELDSPNDLDQDEIIEARDSVDFPIPGVIDSVHWRKPLSHPDANVRNEGLEGLRHALHDAKKYGASTVLLVPAVVNESVAYDVAYYRSQTEIRKVLPLAEELGVKIAIENVWNGFLLSPLEMAQYIDEFESPWIGAYFDVGNIINYGYPEQWIRILSHRIFKVDIKEYSRKQRDESGPRAGFDVKLGEGDVDWKKVMQALQAIGYEGWGSAEVRGGDRTRLKEISDRMDKIFGYTS